MAKSKQKKSTKKTISFDEFKAWLSGVEDLQSDDWYPSKEQWEIIREKIDSIRVELSKSVQQERVQPQRHVEYTGGIRALPPTMSTIGQQEQSLTPIAPPAQQSRHVAKLPTAFEGKTPTIDTSSGNFGSSFE